MSDSEFPLPPHGKTPPARREAANDGGQQPGAGEQPCRWCGELTSVKTLADLGARCFRCYAAYCRGPLPTAKVLSREERVAAMRKLDQLGDGGSR